MHDDQKIQDIKFDKLKRKLRELFQMDKADLDFGIYRIMNQKRAELDVFIDNDLRAIAQNELKKYDTGKASTLQEELDRAIDSARELGVDPETVEKVKMLREQMKTQVSSGDIEGEVYSHLTDFFGRYYDGGDFISQRRYKDGVYAIPYQGEEVKLYWANHDQYYIKTSENFKNFSFLLSSGRKVTFAIVDAETEKDNNKASSDKERRFILAETDFLEVRHDELLIKFEYKPSKEKQDKLTKDAAQRISNVDLADDFSGILDKAPTEKNASRTVLEKWLTHYTSKNTFDYFIHKDLRGFLNQELDFYIKNEMLRIDDLDALNEEVNTRNISKIKAFKHIAKQIVNFLSQLEDFQKLLWEKKKFVVQSDYVFTLDHIDEKYYDEILKNEEQIAEWKKLGFIGANEEIDSDYLNKYQTLQLDTMHFPNIKNEIIMGIEDIDEKINGLLINSDNFAGINALKPKYDSQVQSIYIDPPYNTSASEIAYKNNFKHSSWLSLMENRISASASLMKKNAVMCTTIDDAEGKELQMLISAIFGRQNMAGVVPIKINPSGRPTEKGFALCHEYAIFSTVSKGASISKLPRTTEQLQRFKEEDEVGIFEYRNLRREGSNSDRVDGQRQYFSIFANLSSGTIRVPEMTWSEPNREWTTLESPASNEVEILPINDSGDEKNWRWSIDSIRKDYSQFIARIPRGGTPQVYYKYRPNLEGVTPLTLWADTKFSATEHGTNVLKNLFRQTNFTYPKSIYAVEECINIMSSKKDATILDYFAGSGTTGHAAIRINRSDGGSRKYILVEMGSYFNDVTKPRIQKVIYSEKWKNGKPQDKGESGSSQIVKYIKLESYEDALNNIKFTPRTSAQELLLSEDSKLRQDYTLNYMLNFESEGSDSLVNIERFEDPFNYTLNITGDNNEIKSQKVDLIDTFNYLIGLKVERIEHARGFVVVEGRVAQTGEKTLVVWRNTKEKSNSDLNDFLEKSAYNPADNEFSIIYVNGDNNVENLQTGDENYKVRLIEEEFFKQMFS
jgi:adenine-specific DNA-methyltransferase